MIPHEVMQEAALLGYVSVSEIRLRSGETVYLLISDNAKIGLPMYLHYVDEAIAMSTYDESISLLGEPEFLKES